MSSINTNTSAMNALTTLRSINNQLSNTQDRIGSGLKISSAKDNAAYFSISETMKGDSAMYAAIDEGLTLTKNSLATARLGAEAFQKLAQQFVDRVAFAQSGKDSVEDIEKELDGIVKQMKTTVTQSTFNGDDFVNAGKADGIAEQADKVQLTNVAEVPNTAAADQPSNGVPAKQAGTLTEAAPEAKSRQVVTGISRAGAGGFTATTMDIEHVDLSALLQDFTNMAKDFKQNAEKTVAVNSTVAGATVQTSTQGAEYLKGILVSAEHAFAKATTAATSLGLSEKSIERQQEFLKSVTDTIDTGVGAMVDADMESEAAKLQALQVQQQLATQSLSIANQAPQNLLSLFR